MNTNIYKDHNAAHCTCTATYQRSWTRGIAGKLIFYCIGRTKSSPRDDRWAAAIIRQQRATPAYRSKPTRRTWRCKARMVRCRLWLPSVVAAPRPLHAPCLYDQRQRPLETGYDCFYQIKGQGRNEWEAEMIGRRGSASANGIPQYIHSEATLTCRAAPTHKTHFLQL